MDAGNLFVYFVVGIIIGGFILFGVLGILDALKAPTQDHGS